MQNKDINKNHGINEKIKGTIKELKSISRFHN
jgi:hypothetical protein